MKCSICGIGTVSNERFESTGYTHCKSALCVAAWRRARIEEKGLALVKVHKQGPMWIKKSELSSNSMRRTNGQ